MNSCISRSLWFSTETSPGQKGSMVVVGTPALSLAVWTQSLEKKHLRIRCAHCVSEGCVQMPQAEMCVDGMCANTSDRKRRENTPSRSKHIQRSRGSSAQGRDMHGVGGRRNLCKCRGLCEMLWVSCSAWVLQPTSLCRRFSLGGSGRMSGCQGCSKEGFSEGKWKRDHHGSKTIGKGSHPAY